MYGNLGHWDAVVSSDDIKPINLADYLPEKVADIVINQYEGFGYNLGLYNGVIVKFDECYSNDGTTEICDVSFSEILDDAISWRYELLIECYGEEKYFDETAQDVKEMRILEKYYEEYLK